jgi:hypothetical protein
MTVAQRTKLSEAGGAPFRSSGEGSGLRREVVLIRAGWGSSGYYSEDVLKRDGPKVFPVGTKMYLDHPSVSEEADRPERSVKDLAAVITSTPRMAGIDLVAECELVEHWAPVINNLAERGMVDLSIRAYGVEEYGEAAGKAGPIIQELLEGISVDFVTEGGAGGKVGKLIEEARRKSEDDRVLQEARNMGHWLEARMHRQFTEITDSLFGEGRLTREERISLSQALGDALNAFNASVEANIPQLYERDPSAEPGKGGTAVSERKDRSGGSNQGGPDMGNVDGLSELRESFEQHKKETEARLSEAESRAKAAETRADRAEEKLQLVEAGSVVDQVVKSTEGLPEKAKARVIESVLNKGIPTLEDGRIDEGVLQERARAEIHAEQEYLKVTGAGSGEGTVRGLGESTRESDGESSDALKKVLQRRGLSESAAERAVAGRID